MKFKQTLSVLFYLNRKKETSLGEIPIYIRVTIDGDSSDISLSEKITQGSKWNNEEKKLNGKDAEAVRINTRIAWARATIQDHFMLLGVQKDSVTAAMLKKAFLGENKPKEKASPALNATLSADIDRIIVRLYKYLKAVKKEPENDRRIGKIQRLESLKEERKTLDSSIGNMEKQAARVFDDVEIPKTILSAMDEQLFMMVCKGNKKLLATETLRRWPVTKNKLKAFLLDRYGVKDLLLSKIEFKMAGQFYDYLTIKDGVGHNAAMKHVKNIKQIIDRALTNGWLTINPIKNFKCTYKEPNQEGIVMADIHTLINKDFACSRLNTVRDIFIFCCFTGYAYQDTLYLGPENIITGIDGNKWLAKNREKTDVKEDVPLLRIPEQILEKYKDHPYCVRKGRLLPVMSNQKYNDYLKEMASICGIKRDLTSHIARHTFATTITLENDVPLPTVQKMLGHKSIRTTEKYSKVTRTKISRNMNRLNKELFNEEGNLKGNIC